MSAGNQPEAATQIWLSRRNDFRERRLKILLDTMLGGRSIMTKVDDVTSVLNSYPSGKGT